MVGPGIPDQGVAKGRADDVLDAQERIACSHAAAAGAVDQIDDHGTVGCGEGHRVDAGATDETVGAQAAIEQVVAAAPVEYVVAVAADQRVIAGSASQAIIACGARKQIVKARADNGFETGKHVARRVAATGRAGRKVNGDGAARCRIVERVEPGAAGQDVRSATTGYGVVAGAAIDRIGARVTAQEIVKGRAGHALDGG